MRITLILNAWEDANHQKITYFDVELINMNLASWCASVSVSFVGHIKQRAPLHQRLQVPVRRGRVLQSENSAPVSTAFPGTLSSCSIIPMSCSVRHLYPLPVSLSKPRSVANLGIYLVQVKAPKVFAHGNTGDPDILSLDWPGCPWGWGEEDACPDLCHRTTN
jgi:hypothetical protein